MKTIFSMKKGFTFVEVLISMLLLAVVTGGIVHIFSFGSGEMHRQGRRLEATYFARQLIEALRSRPWADTVLTETHPNFTSPGGGLPVIPTCRFKDNFNGTSEYYVKNETTASYPPEQYKKITTNVSWDEN